MDPNPESNVTTAETGVDWRPNDPYPVLTTDYLERWQKLSEENQTQEEKDTRFKVIEVDLKKSNNRYDHQTFKYENRDFVIRRGQEFTIEVKVDKPFTRGEDVIKLQFVTGYRPRESRGTMFLITPGDAIDITEASAVIDYIDKDGDTYVIRMRANLPCDSVIGRFKMCVRLYNKEDAGTLTFTKYKVEEPIIVLYNPWCKEDTVYLEGKEEREEYILRQTGLIYCGSGAFPSPRPWVFGQFDKDCLEAAIFLLDASTLPYEAYGNPVRVSRCLSAMVNSNDRDRGVLTGNWSGKYEDGTSPSAWNGSVRILEEYMKTKRPVKYGQCWVFSGVLTTVCRAIGLPTRSVTNFSSAHDSDASMTVDFHLNEQGEPIQGLDDSIWNFHVWNEGWFKRPDLPEGNDGWQAFDSTPQEQSDDRMQCGPAPVRAIKEGNVYFGYDTKFVYGEVNGDSISWLVNSAEERKPIFLDERVVGKNISTKAVGKYRRQDLTNDYKYPEGSAEERAIAKKVSQLSSRRKDLRKFYKLQESADVIMEFDGSLKPNMDAEFVFKGTNKSSETRTISAYISTFAKYYTGVNGNKIDRQAIEFVLEPDVGDEFRTTLKASAWLNKIDEDASIGVYVLGKVKETSQAYMYKQTYSAAKPQLEVKVPETKTQVSKPFDVTIKFINPVDLTLTNASFLVEGAGIQNERKIEVESNIEPGQEVTKTITLTPKMTGEREIIASFNSRQLVGIFGATDIEVVE